MPRIVRLPAAASRALAAAPARSPAPLLLATRLPLSLSGEVPAAAAAALHRASVPRSIYSARESIPHGPRNAVAWHLARGIAGVSGAAALAPPAASSGGGAAHIFLGDSAFGDPETAASLAKPPHLPPDARDAILASEPAHFPEGPSMDYSEETPASAPRFPSTAHEDADSASAAEAAACAPGASTGVCSAREPDFARAGTLAHANETQDDAKLAATKAGLAEAVGGTSRLNMAESAFYGTGGAAARGGGNRAREVAGRRDPDMELAAAPKAAQHAHFEAPLDILDAAEQASWSTIVTERIVVAGEPPAPAVAAPRPKWAA